MEVCSRPIYCLNQWRDSSSPEQKPDSPTACLRHVFGPHPGFFYSKPLPSATCAAKCRMFQIQTVWTGSGTIWWNLVAYIKQISPCSCNCPFLILLLIDGVFSPHAELVSLFLVVFFDILTRSEDNKPPQIKKKYINSGFLFRKILACLLANLS